MGGMLFGSGFDPNLLRRSGEKDEEYYSRLRTLLDPDRQIGGVPRERVEHALSRLGRGSRNEVSVVVALLDDELPSGYSSVQESYTFSAGASTSHVFCHAGILQHGEKKIDRENRDYLIKPLTELGVIEPVYLDPRTKSFVPGHPTPKSPNNCHRLAEEFRTLLRLSGKELDEALDRWTGEDAATGPGSRPPRPSRSRGREARTPTSYGLRWSSTRRASCPATRRCTRTSPMGIGSRGSSSRPSGWQVWSRRSRTRRRTRCCGTGKRTPSG